MKRLPDTTDDIIGALIARIGRIPTWTAEKQRLSANLVRLMRRFGYVSIQTNYLRYRLTRIGQSCQFEVPADRTGHLKPYRGQRVRVVCISAGPRSTRTMLAGPIPKTHYCDLPMASQARSNPKSA